MSMLSALEKRLVACSVCIERMYSGTANIKNTVQKFLYTSNTFSWPNVKLLV